MVPSWPSSGHPTERQSRPFAWWAPGRVPQRTSSARAGGGPNSGSCGRWRHSLHGFAGGPRVRRCVDGAVRSERRYPGRLVRGTAAALLRPIRPEPHVLVARQLVHPPAARQCQWPGPGDHRAGRRRSRSSADRGRHQRLLEAPNSSPHWRRGLPSARLTAPQREHAMQSRTDHGRSRPFGVDVMLAGSPYPPIAEYAFLSDCEVTALVAPSGNVEWLCLPRIDSPSVFGAILDRDAGGFRLRAGGRHGAGRAPLPARAPWSSRPAGARPAAGSSSATCCSSGRGTTSTSAPRPTAARPTDYDADHVLLRTVRCVNGEMQLSLDCEPIFDYGRKLGTWEYTGRGLPRGSTARRRGRASVTLTLDQRHATSASRARARSPARSSRRARRASARCHGVRHSRRTTYEEAYKRLVWTAHHWQHWLARGRFPDHPWRTYLERSRADAQGPDLRADRRARRGGDDVAAGDARRRAQLGLPLHAGSATRRSRCGGCTRSGFDWEANDFFYFIADVAERRRRAADHVRRRRRARASTETTLDHLSGYEGARPVRIGNGAYNQHQHDMWGAVLDSVYLHTKSRDRLDERHLADPRAPGRGGDRALARARPGHLGGPRRAAALHLLEGDVLGGGRPRRAAGPAPRGAPSWPTAGRRVADEIHADICANGVDERGVFTQHYGDDRPGRLAAAHAAGALPAARGPRGSGHGARDRRRADRGRPGAALPGRGDRRRADGRGGQLHDLLLLAGVRPRRDRRAVAGPAPLREAALAREPARALRRGDRSARPGGTSATSPRRSPTWR